MPTHNGSQDARFSVSRLDECAPDSAAAQAWALTAMRLAGSPRVRLGVLRSHGRVEYPRSHERDLTEVLPRVPAAVRVYGSDGCCVALCLDFDAKGLHSPAAAARDHDVLGHLLDVLGLRWFSDIAPTGGRHIYLPLDFRLPIDEAVEIVEALAVRFRTLDPGPHRSAISGCIRTPGSVHAAGGYQRLVSSVDDVERAFLWPNSRDDVETLCGAIAGDIEIARERRRAAAVVELDIDAPSDGPVEPLSARLLAIARDGVWDVQRYGQDRSAARQAVITGCAARHWTVQDVYQRLTDGTWPGLAALYAKYRTPAGRLRALRADFAAAQRYLALSGHSPAHSVRKSTTSALLSRRGDPHGDIRTWRAALAATEEHRLPGRAWLSARFVLRALGEAAHKSGSLQVSFGCRSLAEAAGLDHSTVSVLLRRLEGTGWARRIRRGWGEHADTWELTIPEDLRETVTTVRWPRGKIHALRPAFRSLGHVCALVFEAIEQERATSVLDLSRTIQMARSSVHEAVEMLLSWRLVERVEGRLVACPERLQQVAEYLGADVDLYEQMMRHRRERALWRAWLARFETDEYVVAMELADGWHATVGLSEVEAA